jgi:xanthine/CO dehydrogenase XdhC/CoxF family maturation factor
MKSLQQILAAACLERDHPWALATLVLTQGSTYRQIGARMLTAPDGTTLGVLSGGCLEEEIARHGLEVMDGGIPRLVSFDTRKLYGCEGKLRIYIERIPAAGTAGNFLTEVAEKISRRQLCRMRLDYENLGGSRLLPDKALVVEKPGMFTETIPLPTRLLLFGSGPEIAPMRLFAGGLGWTVCDYAHPDELPSDFIPDSQTAAVVMTHKFGRDLAALDRLLPLGLGYVGLLGPKRRHAELLARFQDFRELDPAWLSVLHAPAGLDIGSEAPEEIALSIISEASAVLAERRGGFLREKSTAIHLQEARA